MWINPQNWMKLIPYYYEKQKTILLPGSEIFKLILIPNEVPDDWLKVTGDPFFRKTAEKSLVITDL